MKLARIARLMRFLSFSGASTWETVVDNPNVTMLTIMKIMAPRFAASNIISVILLAKNKTKSEATVKEATMMRNSVHTVSSS